MSAPEDDFKLRLASRDTPEELKLRFEREQRSTERQRETNLEQSLAGFRVGSVPYLNAVPDARPGRADHFRSAVQIGRNVAPR